MGVEEAPVEEGSRSPDRVLQVVTGPIKSSEPEMYECMMVNPKNDVPFHDTSNLNTFL